MNIFVGNLLFEATEANVKKLFEGFGTVVSVAIVMEKKGAKSRGFGFVEMLNDQEAQEAILALNDKEFMGRLLIVGPACPKTDEEREAKKKERMQAKFAAKAKNHPKEGEEHKPAWFNPVFHKTGGYKGGRRTRSFMMKRAAAGIEEPLSLKKKVHVNPMRWRKRSEQPKPWQKSEGESRPWKKPEGQAKPWKKAASGPKPWRKSNERPQKQQTRFKKRGIK